MAFDILMYISYKIFQEPVATHGHYTSFDSSPAWHNDSNCTTVLSFFFCGEKNSITQGGISAITKVTRKSGPPVNQTAVRGYYGHTQPSHD